MSLSVGALAAAQIGLSLVTQLLVLRFVGIGTTTDAYVAAQAIPALITAIVGVSLQNLWLPRFSRIAEQPRAWRDCIADAQGQAVKIALALSLAIGLTAPWWIRWYLPSFSAELRELFLWILAPSLLAAAIGTQLSVLVAAMRAKNRLRRSEGLALLCLAAATALTAWLVPRFGILVVPLIAIGRMVGLYVLLLLHTGWPGFSFRTTPDTRDMKRKLGSLVGGATVIKSMPIVDRYLGAQAAAGGLTLFSLAQLGLTSVATLLERTIVAQAVPEFSRLLARGDVAAVSARYGRILRQLAASVAATGALLVLVRPVWNDLLRLLLQMSPDTAQLVWQIALLLMPGLFILAAGPAAVAVFYALGDTRTPVSIGIYSFVAGVIIKFALFHAFGILGLAAGASLYLAISMVAYHIAVRRRLSQLASSGSNNEIRGQL